jgi:hypothetical protein
VLTTRLDLEALLGAVLWTQRTNPNLTGAMRSRLTEIEGRLMDGITHVGVAASLRDAGRAPIQQPAAHEPSLRDAVLRKAAATPATAPCHAVAGGVGG